VAEDTEHVQSHASDRQRVSTTTTHSNGPRGSYCLFADVALQPELPPPAGELLSEGLAGIVRLGKSTIAMHPAATD
jgi:hypothetical protein